MPSNTIATHPSGLQIKFTEEDHSYVDATGVSYTSGTGIIKQFFPPFDSDAISLKMSEKQNRPQSEILAEWAYASEFGTMLHENCEYQFAGNFNAMHRATTQKEHQAYQVAQNVVNKLQQAYQLCGTELIVFSPRHRVAGTIDLLMFDPNTSTYWLLDWKSNGKIHTSGFNGECALKPLQGLQSCNFTTYSLQLNLYRRILIEEGYLPAGSKVSMALIHIPPFSDFEQFMPVDEMRAEIADCLLYHLYGMYDTMPF